MARLYLKPGTCTLGQFISPAQSPVRASKVRLPYKMTSPVRTLCFLLLLATCTVAWPQDIGTGIALAMSQLEQLAETGGGLRHEQSGEVLGQPISGALNLGMGSAMPQLPMGRRRRSNGRVQKL